MAEITRCHIKTTLFLGKCQALTEVQL